MIERLSPLEFPGRDPELMKLLEDGALFPEVQGLIERKIESGVYPLTRYERRKRREMGIPCPPDPYGFERDDE